MLLVYIWIETSIFFVHPLQIFKVNGFIIDFEDIYFFPHLQLAYYYYLFDFLGVDPR